jgi:tetratricopeptide (TPR) repeat protein
MLMPVKIFFCYAHEDEALLNQLKRHLIPLQRQGLIDVWYDRDINAGTEWEQEIKEHLNTAQIILLLVSPDFMASDYCYGVEMRRALERHEQKEARVIPVILRPVYWQIPTLHKLQALPSDAKPVVSSSWHYQDEAFFNVTEGIRVVVDEEQRRCKAEEEQRHIKQWMEEGNTHSYAKQYKEALAAFEQVIKLKSNSIEAYFGKGTALNALNRHKEALAAFEQVIKLHPFFADAHYSKGYTLSYLERYEEALVAFERAIELAPRYPEAYNSIGKVLSYLERYEEALVAFERAIELKSNYAEAYYNKSLTLEHLGRATGAKNAKQTAHDLGFSLQETQETKSNYFTVSFLE